MDNKEIKFDFGSDSFEDISSFSTRRADEYEDIVSDSSRRRKGGAHSKGRPPRKGKKKKGIALWWSKMRKGQKAAIISLTSVILVLCIGIGWFFSYFDYNYVEMTDDPEDLGIEEVIDEKIVNIALFGIDSRNTKSFKGNSDSIMILSLNTKTKKVKIISVMRDTLVPIEHKGKTTYNKINSAYQKGGPELAIKTLNKIFGLDISEYATVNFFGMKDIIDAVGGIDAELTKAEITKDYGINSMIGEQCQILKLDADDYYIREAGVQHLNGLQAVAYSRIRYVANIWGTNNDYGRTDRQRYVMEQLFNKATKMSKTQYVKLAKALIPCSETSLSYSEIMDLAMNILLHSPSFEQYRIPQEDFIMAAPKGSFGSVVYYDLDYAAKVVQAVIYDDMTVEQYVELNGVEKNSWYKGSSSSGSGTSSKTPSGSSGGSNNSSGNTSKNESDNKSDASSDNESSNNSDSSGDSSGNSSGNSSDSSSNNSSGSSSDNSSGSSSGSSGSSSGSSGSSGSSSNDDGGTPPDDNDGGSTGEGPEDTTP